MKCLNCGKQLSEKQSKYCSNRCSNCGKILSIYFNKDDRALLERLLIVAKEKNTTPQIIIKNAINALLLD